MTADCVFSEYARYYNLLYKDKDYAAEAEYVHRLIQQYSPDARKLLELGSGTGKHAFLLADRGYSIHGIEISREMLNQANNTISARGQPGSQCFIPTFSQGDIRAIRLNEKFDAIISLFHVISYQTTNADVIAAFKTARAHLDSGGIFLFDVWYGPTVLTDRPAVRIKRMSDEHLEITRIADPVMHSSDDTVEINIHVFIRDRVTGRVNETREIHLMRYFFQPEITMLAECTSFHLEHCEEWLTGNPLGIGTWGACFILRAD